MKLSLRMGSSLVWVVAAVILSPNSRFTSLDAAVARSDILHSIDGVLPQAPSIFNDLQTFLNNDAAKELLDYNTYDPSTQQVNGMNTVFYNELNALNGNGYPHQSFNAAISNGNYNASLPVSYVGTDLGTITGYVEGIWGSYSIKLQHIYADATDCASGSLIGLKRNQVGELKAWPGMLSLLFNVMRIEPMIQR